jgi:hypothetical protein
MVKVEFLDSVEKFPESTTATATETKFRSHADEPFALSKIRASLP